MTFTSEVSDPGAEVLTPVVALVDPIRTAKALKDELLQRGLTPIIIQSGLVGELSADLQPCLCADSIDETVAQLKTCQVTRVMGCVDPSVMYADQLSFRLGLPAHAVELSEARRDKSTMEAVVRKAGLRTPQTFETAQRDLFEQYVLSAVFPLVVKPVASGGTDNVHFCLSAGEALHAFDQIAGRRNLLGQLNRSVVAQEYIDGTEYVVDCVTFDGHHMSVDFFEYQKSTHNGRAFIYEKERCLDPSAELSRRLESFAHRVLDALGFHSGPSHMELKVNSAGEIVFIEVGPRLNGGDIFKLVQDVRLDGRSQVSLAIDAATSLAPQGVSNQLMRQGVRVHIVIKGEGRLAGFLSLEDIALLPSFRRIDLHVHVGQVIRPTQDLSDLAGWIDLVHEDPQVLASDEAHLDELLARGILLLEDC